MTHSIPLKPTNYQKKTLRNLADTYGRACMKTSGQPQRDGYIHVTFEAISCVHVWLIDPDGEIIPASMTMKLFHMDPPQTKGRSAIDN